MTYKLDKEYNLLDENDRYLLRKDGSHIKLNLDQISMLKEHKILVWFLNLLYILSYILEFDCEIELLYWMTDMNWMTKLSKSYLIDTFKWHYIYSQSRTTSDARKSILIIQVTSPFTSGHAFNVEIGSKIAVLLSMTTHSSINSAFISFNKP